jgi:hypothetical protein
VVEASLGKVDTGRESRPGSGGSDASNGSAESGEHDLMRSWKVNEWQEGSDFNSFLPFHHFSHFIHLRSLSDSLTTLTRPLATPSRSSHPLSFSPHRLLPTSLHAKFYLLSFSFDPFPPSDDG